MRWRAATNNALRTPIHDEQPTNATPQRPPTTTTSDERTTHDTTSTHARSGGGCGAVGCGEDTRMGSACACRSGDVLGHHIHEGKHPRCQPPGFAVQCPEPSDNIAGETTKLNHSFSSRHEPPESARGMPKPGIDYVARRRRSGSTKTYGPLPRVSGAPDRRVAMTAIISTRRSSIH